MGLIIADLLQAFLQQADQGFMITGFQENIRALAQPVVPEHWHIVGLAKGGNSSGFAVFEPGVKFVFCGELQF